VTVAIDDVIGQAKRLVTPSAAAREATVRVAEKVVSKVKESAKTHPEVAGVFLGGSFAKDTWLAGDVDIDVFVKISTSVDEKRFEEIGLSVGRESLRGYKPGKKYAQHPYTEAVVDEFKVNVVPCYDVKPGEWRSAADRSVHHVVFVRENLDDEARLQVRLLKRFMKGVGVYGAEIEKEGFSGYATEALIHNYATFESTLRSFAVFVPDSKEEYFTLFDPIDDARDLGKAMSRETVARMVLASRAFLETPSLAYFERVSGRARPRLQRRVYVIAFEHEELSEDTLWGELKRSARQIAKHVREEGFALARAEAASDNKRSSAIILLPVNDSLSDLEERVGPAIELVEGAKNFVAKNRDTAQLIWVGEDGRLRLLAIRRFTSLRKLLDEILDTRVEEIGVSREVARALKRSGKVLQGEKLRREAGTKAWLREGLEKTASDSVGV
jgi:tRNA nucleotidyltransferase (CCA-adding enzyme)